MFEAKATYTLETPLGDLTFGSGDKPYALFTTISSDMSIRRNIDNLPQDDGAIVGDGYAESRIITGTGVLMGSNDETTQEMAQRIRGYVNRMMRSDGLLKWMPSGFPPLQVAVRRFEKPSVEAGRGFKKDLQLSFIAGDPRVYTQELHEETIEPTASTGFTSPMTGPIVQEGTGEDVTITNDGDTDSPPVLRVYGPCSNPVIQNITTGQSIVFAGLAIGDGDYLEIDTIERTVFLNGDEEADRYAYYDAANSDMWRVEPGDNQIRFSATGTGPNTECVVQWRDAWLP